MNKLGETEVPPFSYGINNLGISGENERKEFEKFVDNWFRNPASFLNFEKYSPPPLPSISNKKELGESCFTFKSFVDKGDTAKFFASPQPFYGRGERIAFIIIPHWSSHFGKYKLGTSVIRNFFIPTASYRYFPTYKTEKFYKDRPRYDIVGPDLGLIIKRVWQDTLNIQYFAKYLKEDLGYEKVGLWATSIGSLRGYLASMFSENLIDFLIMHSLADSFPKALLGGISTQPIAKAILENTDEEETEFLLSPLSPGHYGKYLTYLPKNTRLVQGKYDLVFGEENNRRMVEKLRRNAPFVEIEYGKFGHTTYGEVDKVIPMVFRNSKFVFRNSKLRFLI
ncbi:TPA: hypothetical protein DHW59_02410 [candidate division CPR2 bacterium]|nr:hypothetical protein [candidate division CPR2 bacterium]